MAMKPVVSSGENPSRESMEASLLSGVSNAQLRGLGGLAETLGKTHSWL